MKRYAIEKYTMKTEEVASLLGLNVQSVRIKARTGQIHALQVGRKWMFCEEEITDILHDMTVKVIAENTTNIKEDNGEANNKEPSDIFC